MIGRHRVCLGVALLVLVLNNAVAYHGGGGGHSAGHHDGLSHWHGHGHGPATFDNDAACPPDFRGLKPYAHDCHRYINCGDGRPVIQSCAPGTVFSVASQTCDFEGSVPCEQSQNSVHSGRSSRLQELPLEPRCAPGATGMQPHPNDCTKFLHCDNGRTFIKDCGPGTAFSPSLQICDFKHKVDCGYVGSYAGAGAALTQVSGGASGGLSCPPFTLGFYPHPHDPHKYLKCGNGVEAIVETCPLGEIFDGHRLICIASGISAERAHVSSSARLSGLYCPDGVEGLFAHPFDNTRFLNCKAGKLTVQNCHVGHVFSLYKGYCLSKLQLVYNDYVAYTVSQISVEYSLILDRCPANIDGVHPYPFDASKYIHCAQSGELTIVSCGDNSAYSYIQNTCRPVDQVKREERVKFLWELSLQCGIYSYSETQGFQFKLTFCPHNLQGSFVYPFHAGYYVVCKNGVLQVKACPADTFYSMETRRCQASNQLTAHKYLDYSYTNVQLSSQFIEDLTKVNCPSNAQGYYLHPFDCTKYLICRDQQTYVENCDKGKVFSISQRSCVARDQLQASYDRVDYLTEVENEFTEGNEDWHRPNHGRANNEGGEITRTHAFRSTVTSCPPNLQGSFAYPFSAAYFVVCQNGVLQVKACPPGTFYSLAKRSCQASQGMAIHEYLDYTYTAPPLSSQSMQGLTTVVCPGNAQGYYLHPFDSAKYLICRDQETYIESCEQGKVFSISQRSCLAKEQLQATYDRVDYLTENQHGYSQGNDAWQHTNQGRTNYAEGAGKEIHVFQSTLTSCPHSLQGSFAYPFHPGYYVICQNGVLQVQACPPGTFYSLTKRSCQASNQLVSHEYLDYAYTAAPLSSHSMQGLTTVVCPGNAQGYYLHPFDCTKYLICRDQQTYIESCEQGKVFSISHRSCLAKEQLQAAYDRVDYLTENQHGYSPGNEAWQHTSQGSTNDGEVLCPPGSQGQLPHPLDCSKFLRCANGQTFIQSCAPGTAFSASQLICTFKHQVECGERRWTVGISGGSSANSIGSVAGPTCPSGTRGLHPHPSDLHKYLRCGIGVQPTVEQCPPGKIFDGHSLVCVSSGVVPSNEAHGVPSAPLRDLYCPSGTEGLFAHPFDQTKFLNCKAGKVAIQSCIAGNVFSLSKGYCLSKVQLITSDYVTFIKSEFYLELSRCPPGTEGHHPYPYDASYYVRCDVGGQLSIVSCGQNSAYSYIRRTCLPADHVRREERVKFFAELSVQGGGYGYSETQSKLTSCPPSLQGSFAYPFSAAYFVVCQNGVLQVQPCSPGTFYSLAKRSCQASQGMAIHEYLDYTYTAPPLSSHSMQGLTTVVCPGNAQGYYLHPFDCTKYLICRDQQTYIETCEQGKVFSISQRSCLAKEQLQAAYDRVDYLTETQHGYSQGNEAWQHTNLGRTNYAEGAGKEIHVFQSTLTSCPPSLQGSFAYPFSAAYFVVCQNGVLQVKACPPGTFYSLAKRSCQASQGMAIHEYLDYTYTEPPLSSHSMQGLTTVVCPGNAQGYYLHPFDCTKYLICRDQQTYIESCEQGKVFSISQRSCLAKEQLQAAYDRVDYLTETQHGYSQGNEAWQHTNQGRTNYAEGAEKEIHVFQSTLTSCPHNLQGSFAYPFHPGYYVICQNGALQVQACHPGTFYSLAKRSCQVTNQLVSHEYLDYTYTAAPLSAYSVQGLTTVTCPNNAQGYYLHPFDCTKYLICRDQQTYIESCEQGKVFSISQRSCLAKEQLQAAYDRVDYLTETQHEIQQGNQQSTESHQFGWTQGIGSLVCPPGTVGHFAHPFDCSKYLNCAQGKTLVEDCQAGWAFDRTSSQCARAEQVDCTGRSSATNQESRFQLICPSQVYGTYANPFDARSYLYCVEGRTEINQCLPNEFFSLSRGCCHQAEQVLETDRVTLLGYGQQQQQQFSVVCPPDAVGAHPYPFDCRRYLSCEAGVTRLLSCPADSHFSLSHRSCLHKEQVQRTDRTQLLSDLRVLFEWWQQLKRLGNSSASVTCPPGVTGDYQHPTLQHKFISCATGSIFDCPPGQLFSLRRRLCVPAHHQGAHFGDHFGPGFQHGPGSHPGFGFHHRPGFPPGSFPGSHFGSGSHAGSGSFAGSGSLAGSSVHSNSGSFSGSGAHSSSGSFSGSDSGHGWIDLRHDQREPKAHTGGYDQYASGSGIKTTYTQSQAGDRWSDMNMQRPAGIGFAPTHPAGWSGEGSSYNQQAPTQTVLYVEGSLQPKRNYTQSQAISPIYHAPLAPMATTPASRIYYAQPVEEEPAATNSWPRQSHSRKLDEPLQPSRLHPVPSYSSSLPGQRPLELDYRPDENLQPFGFQPLPSNSLSGQQPLDLDYQPDESLQPSRLHPLPSPDSTFLPGQRPLELDYQPEDRLDQPPRPFYRRGDSRQQSEDPIEGFQPPVAAQPSAFQPPLSNLAPLNPPTTPTQPSPFQPPLTNLAPLNPPPPAPGVPANDSPVYRPPADESNLYGGLQPPLLSVASTTPASSLRTYPIYPVLGQTPHYSPSYSGVAHSRNSSWAKVPAHAAPDAFNPQEDEDDYDQVEVESTTAQDGLRPPPFDHQFYNPTQSASPPENAITKDALNQALRLLLHPYLNHSGNVPESMAQRAESAIASAISRPPTTNSSPTTTRKPRRQPDDEVELIVASEQASLNETDIDDLVPDEGETSRTEQTLNPTTYASSYDTDNFHRSTRSVVSVDSEDSSTVPNSNPRSYPTPTKKGLTHGHSRQFHQNHPNLPNPFDKPRHFYGPNHHTPEFHSARPWFPNPYNKEGHSTPKYPYSHFGHSREFHAKHPEVPTPFDSTKGQTPEVQKAFPNADGSVAYQPIDLDLSKQQPGQEEVPEEVEGNEYNPYNFDLDKQDPGQEEEPEESGPNTHRQDVVPGRRPQSGITPNVPRQPESEVPPRPKYNPKSEVDDEYPHRPREEPNSKPEYAPGSSRETGQVDQPHPEAQPNPSGQESRPGTNHPKNEVEILPSKSQPRLPKPTIPPTPPSVEPEAEYVPNLSGQYPWPNPQPIAPTKRPGQSQQPDVIVPTRMDRRLDTPGTPPAFFPHNTPNHIPGQVPFVPVSSTPNYGYDRIPGQEQGPTSSYAPNPSGDPWPSHTPNQSPSRENQPTEVPSVTVSNTPRLGPSLGEGPLIDFRNNLGGGCQFRCGDGNCVKNSQVCDGVNDCRTRKDEQHCEHLGYQLRLSGGEQPHMGRIEVKVNGKWGYVCDNNFALPAAHVACRELGYKLGAVAVRGNSHYEPPEQNFNYVMDGVQCQGNETNLKDCQFKGWNKHSCGLHEVVGIVCKVPTLRCPPDTWLCSTTPDCIPMRYLCDNTNDCPDKSDESYAVCKAPPQYRLAGGRSANEGRLEVKYRNVWGTVCDDDFNQRTAQVACNSLGYYGVAKIEKKTFGPGSGPIWLAQVMCRGNETSLDKCSHFNWGTHNCRHEEDVGLRCSVGQQLRNNAATQTISRPTFSDIGLWERSSKALHTPRRCGIFKEDLLDEFAQPEEREVKGNAARRGRHPWQATIRQRERGGMSSHWCGAVVISKRHLLTTAECVYGKSKGSLFVRVGDHYANIEESSEVDSQIANWYIHEQFRKPTHMSNDIAVVVLKTPLRFNDYVQPICLPERGAPLKENRTCTISGFGSIKSGMSTPSHELRAAELTILPMETCKQKNVYGDAMTGGMFCAGSMVDGSDACEGDRGGPLVCSDEDGETLYGIISWGQHCGFRNRPGVYVRVCQYIDWIYEKINQSLRRMKRST